MSDNLKGDGVRQYEWEGKAGSEMPVDRKCQFGVVKSEKSTDERKVDSLWEWL